MSRTAYYRASVPCIVVILSSVLDIGAVVPTELVFPRFDIDVSAAEVVSEALARLI